jgi:AAA15 family ATPase/GTPase
LWDNIALTDAEEHVLMALRIIAPEVERVNLIGTTESNRISDRTAIVKTASSSEPVPLRSLGDGMNRLFGIALALVNSKGGMLLIDEIENGLHYSVQADVWELIFQTARQLDIQVFVTTHSWDCISAFQKAAQENPEDGVLIRLETKNGIIKPTLFDEKKLAIATREQIEIR